MKSMYLRRSLTGLLTMLAGLPAIAQLPVVTSTPIQHVVVIFQENVSFDHYFATYPTALNTTQGEPGFVAAANTPTVNGLTGALLTRNQNAAQPFRLSRSLAVICDQDHNYGDEQKAFNSGLMNKFVESVGVSSATCDVNGYGKNIVMSYYDGNTVTAVWNYAQNFAMSDNSFGTTFGPSTPGALNLTAGQTHGATVTAGSPAGVVSAGSVIGDGRPSLALDDCTIASKTLITMSGKNVGDLLNAKGLTWGWFQGGFKPSSRNADGTAVCATAHNNISGASAGTDYIPHHEPFQYYPQTANPHHMPPTSVQKIGQTDQANHQYDTSDFFAALSAGVLPAVSYLKAPAYQDGHAGYSDPLDEQTFLVGTINSLEQSPFWSSTAIIIAYDDSDGFYDHVIGPIINLSATPDDNLTGAGACGDGTGAAYQGRCGYGPRLPLLVISPYAKVNYVDHTVTDQSSILKFIEDNWNLGRLGDNSTDALAGSLLGMFNFTGSSAKAVYLDPTMGTVVAPPTTGSGTPTNQTTTAVANPKNATVTSRQFQLDGTASTSFDGKPLTYSWTQAPGSLPAAILGGSTATPTIQFGSNRGAYTFILTVTDSKGNTSTDTTTITYAGQ
jgi:phospholipase C